MAGWLLNDFSVHRAVAVADLSIRPSCSAILSK